MARLESMAQTFGALRMPLTGLADEETVAAPEARLRSDRPLTLHSVAAHEWDACVADFDEISQQQTLVFASRRWRSIVPEPVVFCMDQKIVGGALVMVQPIAFGIGAVAVVNGGPMFRDARIAGRAEIHRAMIGLLVREYAKRRHMMLTVQLHAATAPEDAHYDDLLSSGFERSSELPFPDRYLVNLQSADDAHRKSLHQKWRYHLAKSEKEGLVFEHAGTDAVGRFTALYEAMSQRKNFPDYSAFGTLPALLNAEEAALRPELFFVRQNDETVAGAAIFKAGETASYLYGATSDRALPLRAGYFMHWHIIRWLKQNTRARWYDLGGTDGFHGLHQFKKGLVGDCGIIAAVPPRANFASGRFPLLLGRGAFAVRDAFHATRRLVGSLWDHHAKPDLTPGKTRSE